MATVQTLLDTKGTRVFSVGPDTPLMQALQLMAKEHIGALLVVQPGTGAPGGIVGIFSERDFARRAAASPDVDLGTPVSRLMSTPVYVIGPDRPLEECMALMSQGHFRHLPVVKDGMLKGLISIGDVVKQLISEKEQAIDDLEHFIWVNMI